MQRHAERLEPKLFGQSKFFEAEKVFVNVLGKVTTDELLASIMEGTDAICTNTLSKGRTLVKKLA